MQVSVLVSEIQIGGQIEFIGIEYIGTRGKIVLRNLGQLWLLLVLKSETWSQHP